MNALKKGLLTVAFLAAGWTGAAVAPLPEEMAEAQRWAEAKLGRELNENPPEPAVIVWTNHDPVQKNSRAGNPPRIAAESYSRGLYRHAPSKLDVRLPGPGESFTAIIRRLNGRFISRTPVTATPPYFPTSKRSILRWNGRETRASGCTMARARSFVRMISSH